MYLLCSCFLSFVSRMMSSLSKYDTGGSSDDRDKGRCPQVVIVSTIDLCNTRILTLVSGFRIGVDKPLELIPDSDEMVCIRGYLLAWRLLLKYLQFSTVEVRS